MLSLVLSASLAHAGAFDGTWTVDRATMPQPEPGFLDRFVPERMMERLRTPPEFTIEDLGDRVRLTKQGWFGTETEEIAFSSEPKEGPLGLFAFTHERTAEGVHIVVDGPLHEVEAWIRPEGDALWITPTFDGKPLDPVRFVRVQD